MDRIEADIICSNIGHDGPDSTHSIYSGPAEKEDHCIIYYTCQRCGTQTQKIIPQSTLLSEAFPNE